MNVNLLGCVGSFRVASRIMADTVCLEASDAEVPDASPQGARRVVTTPLTWHELPISELTLREQQARKIASFVDCCLRDVEPPVTVEDGRAALEVIQAAYASAEFRAANQATKNSLAGSFAAQTCSVDKTGRL